MPKKILAMVAAAAVVAVLAASVMALGILRPGPASAAAEICTGTLAPGTYDFVEATGACVIGDGVTVSGSAKALGGPGGPHVTGSVKLTGTGTLTVEGTAIITGNVRADGSGAITITGGTIGRNVKCGSGGGTVLASAVDGKIKGCTVV